MRYDRVFHSSRNILVPMKEARAIVSVPDASLLETASVLKEESSTLEIAQKHDGALSDILLVSVRLAYRIAV